MEKAQFGARLRELREAAGLSREQLAEKAGLKVGGVRDIEQGRRMPLFDTAISLAKALGISCEALLQEPADRPAQGRGRPAKPKADEPEKPKRGRGRPRKER